MSGCACSTIAEEGYKSKSVLIGVICEICVLFTFSFSLKTDLAPEGNYFLCLIYSFKSINLISAIHMNRWNLFYLINKLFLYNDN